MREDYETISCDGDNTDNDCRSVIKRMCGFPNTGWLQEGLVILVVNSQENADDVRQFVEENGFSFTVLLDITGEVGYKYNVRGLPATFLIDKDVIIRNVTIEGFWDKAQIEQRLNLITKEQKG